MTISHVSPWIPLAIWTFLSGGALIIGRRVLLHHFAVSAQIVRWQTMYSAFMCLGIECLFVLNAVSYRANDLVVWVCVVGEVVCMFVPALSFRRWYRLLQQQQRPRARL